MAILTTANVSLAFGHHQVLDGASFTLQEGERVGLVGRNGCGKSTLLKLCAGLGSLRPDAGQVQLARGASIGYLTQDPDLDPEQTLYESACDAFAHLAALHEQAHDLAHDMAEADGEQLDRLMKQYERLEQQIEAAGGYAVEHQVEATLHGLGLTDNLFNVKVADLSGGQKGRLALARLLLAHPQVLLLDEPTNHLDIAGREWLEQFLRDYSGAVVLISHDRWLLDRVVCRIYELVNGRLEEYPGNYQQYRQQRAERQLALSRAYERQQVRIRQEQAFIDRYRAGQRARQAKGREKRLERFVRDEQLERPIELEALNMTLREPARCSDVVISAEGLAKGYDGKPLFAGLDLSLKRGQRLGIIGPNGAGKTTLVQCLLGRMQPDAGTVRVGSGVEVGYYRQLHDEVDPNLTVVDYLRRFVPNGTEQEARDLAGAFLFSGLEQDKTLGMLSGGERSRARLAGLVAGGHNLLVLDEPTNHLDIPSAERLEDGLRRFCRIGERRKEKAGTLILITHDRMLLEDLVDHLIILDGQGGARLFHGSYSAYHDQRDAEAALGQAAPGAGAEAPAGAAPPRGNGGRGEGGSKAAAGPKSSPGRARGSGKAAGRKAGGRNGRDAATTRLSDEQLEQRIVELEGKLAEIDARLADPASYRDPDQARSLQQQRQELAQSKQPLEAEWLRRAEQQ